MDSSLVSGTVAVAAAGIVSAAAPIEDWMIFLHPDQRTVVQRRYEGPARVRGSAGTGKTVVALHRAVELAKRFKAEEAAPKPRGAGKR